MVRTTEVVIAPEIGGQLGAINVRKGDHVHAGDVLAELATPLEVQKFRSSLGICSSPVFASRLGRGLALS